MTPAQIHADESGEREGAAADRLRELTSDIPGWSFLERPGAKGNICIPHSGRFQRPYREVLGLPDDSLEDDGYSYDPDGYGLWEIARSMMSFRDIRNRYAWQYQYRRYHLEPEYRERILARHRKNYWARKRRSQT